MKFLLALLLTINITAFGKPGLLKPTQIANKPTTIKAVKKAKGRTTPISAYIKEQHEKAAAKKAKKK